MRIQIKVQIFLKMNFFPDHRIKNRIRSFRIPSLVLQENFLQNSRFPYIRHTHVIISPTDMHSVFRTCHSSQNRPILDQSSFNTFSGSCNGGADSGHSSSNHNKIIAFFNDLPHHLSAFLLS